MLNEFFGEAGVKQRIWTGQAFSSPGTMGCRRILAISLLGYEIELEKKRLREDGEGFGRTAATSPAYSRKQAHLLLRSSLSVPHLGRPRVQADLANSVLAIGVGR